MEQLQDRIQRQEEYNLDGAWSARVAVLSTPNPKACTSLYTRLGTFHSIPSSTESKETVENTNQKSTFCRAQSIPAVEEIPWFWIQKSCFNLPGSVPEVLAGIKKMDPW